MDGIIDENIHPCKGCEDYIPPKDCKSKGGCGRHNTFYKHMPEDFIEAVITIMGYCQYEDCDEDCSCCPRTLSEIRCNDMWKESKNEPGC